MEFTGQIRMTANLVTKINKYVPLRDSYMKNRCVFCKDLRSKTKNISQTFNKYKCNSKKVYI